MNDRSSLSNLGTRRFLPFLVLLFIGSGCAALIYEVIWLQMLQLVVGLTSLSLGVLLGTFMGGMFLGSLLVPRLFSSKYHPLRLYAIFELGIGLFGLTILFGLPLIEKIYAGMPGYGLFGSILLRAAIAAVCLLPPTILMGATLPVISRWVESTPKGVAWMGFFYGGNIFGAVAGCLVAGFYLLRVYDMAIATYCALLLNIAVAVFSLVIAGNSSFNNEPVSKEQKRIKVSGLPLVYLTIGLSGMAALGGEVIWTRLLSVMLGSTVYTFSVILAAILIGLGIGSSTGAYISGKTRRPGQALATCQVLLILAIAWTSYTIAYTIPNRPVDMTSVSDSWHLFAMDLIHSALAVVPPALLWGASFPLAIAAVATKDKDPGRLVGGIYAANTTGAILGSLGFSLIGIPVLGTALSQKFMVIISCSAAILMFIFSFLSQKAGQPPLAAKKKITVSLRFGTATVLLVLVVILVTENIETVPWNAVAFGRYMRNYSTLPGTDPDPQSVPDSIMPLYYGEGLNGSVVVTQLQSGVRQFHSIGKIQASTNPMDMRLQRMLGHITALLTEKPDTVLVIGCGAGITAGTFVTHPDVKKVIVCDIEPLVPKMVAPFFSKENYGIADGIEKENPHLVKGKEVKFEYDDGRHYISTTNQKFDIISSDPIDPWAKGTAALYSEDFYRICKDHLKPGGSISMWVPLYRSSFESAKSMISTFLEVFPNGIIWSNDNFGQGYDAVLFAQAEPLHIDIEKLEKKFRSPDYSLVRKSLREVGFYNIRNLLGTYAGRGKDLALWLADAQISTDRNMRLSYLSGMAIQSYEADNIFWSICDFYRFPSDLFIGTSAKLDSLQHTIENKMWANQQE